MNPRCCCRPRMNGDVGDGANPIDREWARVFNDPGLQSSIDESEYKRMKEAIVSGRTGTSVTELLILSFIVPSAFLLRSVVTGCLVQSGVLKRRSDSTKSAFDRRDACGFVVDIVCLCVVPLLAFALPNPSVDAAALFAAILAVIAVIAYVNSTLYLPAHYPRRAFSLVLAPTAVCAVCVSDRRLRRSSVLSFADRSEYDGERRAAVSGKRKQFLSDYRVGIMLMTVIAILAVDFPVLFPRRHCKTEHFGVSLMDAGVGAFIFSHAITSAAAHAPHAPHAEHADSSDRAHTATASSASSFRSVLWSVFRNVLPLIGLGCSRLFAVRSTDYHVHVSEYGVHWNFFFTLAAVALAAALITPLIPTSHFATLGFVLLTAYQIALTAGGLERWLLTADRSTGFIAANKEGLCSAIGYFALYLIAFQIGTFIHRSAEPSAATAANPSDGSRERWSRLGRVLWVAAVMSVLGMVSHAYIEAASRQMVNWTYVLLTIALNMMLLGSYLFCCLIVAHPIEWSSALVDAINFNSLAVFLVANLCTGLVNLRIRTLFVPTVPAFAVMLAYIVFVMAVATVMHRFGRRLKFW